MTHPLTALVHGLLDFKAVSTDTTSQLPWALLTTILMHGEPISRWQHTFWIA